MIELHKCAIECCGEHCPRHHLMCVRHWRMVPAFWRAEVIAAWKANFQHSGRPGRRALADIKRLRMAQARAIASVREKELKKFANREVSQRGLAF